MRLSIRSLFLALTLASSALAQTYTPKRIVIEGPIDLDRSDALSIAALKTPEPITKEDIEAALGRLADSGLFSDISYKVDSNVLTITLSPSASSQIKPVILANFVWWKPGELEPLLEARMPSYQGKLPPVGHLTDKVEAALIAMLHEKGIDAKIETREAGHNTVLSVSSPEVVIDKVEITGSIPALQSKVDFVTHHLHGEDFDLGETTESVVSSLNVTYQDAGYLDVSTTPPAYSNPHKDLNNYAVDITATVTPGEPYHVSATNIHAAAPVSQSTLESASAIKPGDIASTATKRLAIGEIQRAYREEGYYGAAVHWNAEKNTQAHTVSYDVTINPGDLYHFARLDLSSLPPDEQAAFTKAFTVQPGAPAGKDLRKAATVAGQSVREKVTFGMNANNEDHTVTVTVKPAKGTASH